MKDALRPWWMRAWIALAVILAVAAMCGADELVGVPA